MYRNFPKRYGGSEQPPDPLRETIIGEEMDASEVPWRLQAQGVGMIVPTLLEVGAEWQREKFIEPTLNGEFVWCQGYSEPGAGSDLASLRSTAVLDGDEWVINGHKIWTSDAQDSNYMFGMFRSEPDAPKHGGISYLLLEVDQPGIEIRPLRQITGVAHFSEVFFTDVRTPADWIVGERGQGWQVARVNLKYERNLGGAGYARRQLRDLVDLAKRSTLSGRPALEDSGIRRRLAEIECRIRCIETTGLRTLSAAASGEEDKLGITLIVNKLYRSDTTDLAGRLAYDLIGEDGLRAPTDETYGHVRAGISSTGWIDQYLYALAGAIAAGSSNIQRNIVGERGLGLPRDIRASQVR
jgi:alkylation response protein AidB-like acyl-CoA dehydrogenase